MKRETVAVAVPGKIILFGEHAVVYARPAIAAPVFQVRAQVSITSRDDARVVIEAEDLGRTYDLRDAPSDDPLAETIRRACALIGAEPEGFRVRIHSTIPIASGMGSGAAVSIAITRAVSDFFAHVLSCGEVSALAYEIEKLHHGTPSGIDNTVIALEQPVFFTKDRPIESFRAARPFTIVIGDTGIAAPTKIAVGDVRRAWEADRIRYESLFSRVGVVVHQARAAIENGNIDALGPLMRTNQQLLRDIGVSAPEIETLVEAALRAGASGAKLSGAGRGGNVIALADAEACARVEHAMLDAGAKQVIVTEIK